LDVPKIPDLYTSSEIGHPFRFAWSLLFPDTTFSKEFCPPALDGYSEGFAIPEYLTFFGFSSGSTVAVAVLYFWKFPSERLLKRAPPQPLALGFFSNFATFPVDTGRSVSPGSRLQGWPGLLTCFLHPSAFLPSTQRTSVFRVRRLLHFPAQIPMGWCRAVLISSSATTFRRFSSSAVVYLIFIRPGPYHSHYFVFLLNPPSPLPLQIEDSMFPSGFQRKFSLVFFCALKRFFFFSPFYFCSGTIWSTTSTAGNFFSHKFAIRRSVRPVSRKCGAVF